MKPPLGAGVGARETSDRAESRRVPRQYTHNRDSTVGQNLVKTCFVTGTPREVLSHHCTE